MGQKTFIFFGSSGSGKGTQAKLLIDYLEREGKKKVIYIETGQGFREFLESGTYTSKLTKRVLDRGGLLPAFLPIWFWTSRFNRDFTGSEDMVLDGLCRRPDEAPILDGAIKFYKLSKPFVVLLNVSRKWSIDRLLGRGRYDDTSESINKRLDWYEKNVAPAVDFFRNNPDYIFLDVFGERSIEEIHKDILERIKSS